MTMDALERLTEDARVRVRRPGPPDPEGRCVVYWMQRAQRGRDNPALNVAVMSNVAPEYAPSGQALVAAACPGLAATGLEAAVRAQLRGWWGEAVDDWRHLRTDVIEHGQPDCAPPFAPKRPVALGDGIFVCGDHRDTPSIQGALYSGRRTADAVLASLV